METETLSGPLDHTLMMAGSGTAHPGLAPHTGLAVVPATSASHPVDGPLPLV